MCQCSCIFSCAFSLSEARLVRWDNLPVLEVSGKFSGNDVLKALFGDLHFMDTVSIELAVVLSWFGNRFQEAVWPVFGNVSFVCVQTKMHARSVFLRSPLYNGRQRTDNPSFLALKGFGLKVWEAILVRPK